VTRQQLFTGPMLAPGRELHCIGAPTFDEYRKHIEREAALERPVFQPVFVGISTVRRGQSILRGIPHSCDAAIRGSITTFTIKDEGCLGRRPSGA